MVNPDVVLQRSASVVVARPAEELWDLVADVTRMGAWSPVVVECRWDDGDGPRAGAWFTGRNSAGGRTWETRSLVVAAERGRELTWHVNGSWARWSWTFAPVDGDPGSTVVTESWEFLPDGLAGFAQRHGEDAAALVAARSEAARTGIPATLAAFRAAAEVSPAG